MFSTTSNLFLGLPEKLVNPTTAGSPWSFLCDSWLNFGEVLGQFGQIVVVGGLWNHQLTVKKVGLGRWLGFGLGYTEKVAIPDSFSGIQSEAIWHQWTISWFPVFKVGIIYGFSQRKPPPVARTPSRKYGLMIRAYFINHWFPLLIRAKIQPLFLGGCRL